MATDMEADIREKEHPCRDRSYKSGKRSAVELTRSE